MKGIKEVKEGLYVEVKKINTPPFPYDENLTLSCVWSARVACYHAGKKIWTQHATPGTHQVFKKDAIIEAEYLIHSLRTQAMQDQPAASKEA